MAIEMAKVQPTDNVTKAPFVFEIRLQSSTYFVGEDPTFGGRQGNFVVSPESGSGLEQARYWEHAIRQALMPVTPTTSANVVGGMWYKLYKTGDFVIILSYKLDICHTVSAE